MFENIVAGALLFAFVVWMYYPRQVARSAGQHKFILLNDKGRLVRAKVLTEHDTWYKVVTMDDHDDGAVELRIQKNDPRLIRVYEE